jgi:hypothetical protein
VEIEATAQDFLEWISEALRAEYELLDGAYIFRLRPYPSGGAGLRECTLAQESLESIIENLSTKEEHEETVLYDPNQYEVLVSDHSALRPGLPTRRWAEGIRQHDQAHGITYTLSRPTDEYILFLLYRISQIAPMQAVWRGPLPPRLGRSMNLRAAVDPEEAEEDTTQDIGALEILKLASRRLLTLRLESTSARQLSDFTDHANSFLFQLSYNLDLALSLQFYLDELVRAGRIARVRRQDLNRLEAPRRHYLPDVVYHYQQGVATDNPPSEYLSYYHIAEHFFEQVFNDELVDHIQSTITRPDFSYGDRDDNGALVRAITKRLKIRDEEVTFSEQEALRLTIQRYVDVEELRREIEQYDASLLEHYKTNKVPFSDGDTVNLADTDPTPIVKALAGRIYKTRNSIVHSKEGERRRYIPFRHDRILVREVPLIRFIAEAIILSTSSLIR